MAKGGAKFEFELALESLAIGWVRLESDLAKSDIYVVGYLHLSNELVLLRWI